ncbi:MAG TPA: hypothetical protein VFF59_02600 [Anaerolineae bacterium]|nr:hypothetical protein [Anaerolineae bacterium]
MFFAIAAFLYLLSPIYKFLQLTERSDQLIWHPTTIAATHPISLTFGYPSVLHSDGYGTVPQSLSVWMQYVETNTTSLVAESYVVTFAPWNAGILFVDKDGTPIAPQVEITPGQRSPTAAVAYLIQAPDGNPYSLVTLKYAVYDSKGNEVAGSTPFAGAIRLEYPSETILRHIVDILADPVAPLVPLAVALSAYAMREWQGLQNQRREKIVEAIDRLPEIAEESLVTAAQQYAEMVRRSQEEDRWKDPAVKLRLEAAWPKIKSFNWPVPILDEAVIAWAANNHSRAKELVELVVSLEKDSALASDVGLAFECINARTHDWLGKFLGDIRSRNVVAALVSVLDHFSNDQLRTAIVETLADLAGRENFVDKIKQQLSDTSDRRKILEATAFAEPLRRLSENALASTAARHSAESLLNLRRRRPPWLQLWRTSPMVMSDSLARYLQQVGLAFNPFGPESAELDPHLTEYAASDQVEPVRGRKRVIMLGEPGSGLTATALLLAHQCDDPSESPVEADAFPVYYPVFQLNDDRGWTSCYFLRSIAHALARTLLRFAAVRPYGWLELPNEKRDQLGALLLTSFGSRDGLLGEMRRVAPDPEYRWLAYPIESAKFSFTHADNLDEIDWLGLIAGSTPSGFDSIYVLLDVKDFLASNAAAANLKMWFDLSTSLAANNVYLKIFAPASTRSLISNDNGFDSVTLTWDSHKLSQTMRDRFGRAGGDSLAALCGPDVPHDVDELFIQAALKSKAPPRQLIRLGNRLLLEHAVSAPDQLISGDEIERVLGNQLK